MSVQDGIAYLIVGVAAGVAFRHFYRKYVVGPLSTFFLKRGRVGLAMRIRNGKSKSVKNRGGGGRGDCCD